MATAQRTLTLQFQAAQKRAQEMAQMVPGACHTSYSVLPAVFFISDGYVVWHLRQLSSYRAIQPSSSRAMAWEMAQKCSDV